MTDSVPTLSVRMKFALETLLPTEGRVNVYSILGNDGSKKEDDSRPYDRLSFSVVITDRKVSRVR